MFRILNNRDKLLDIIKSRRTVSREGAEIPFNTSGIISNSTLNTIHPTIESTSRKLYIFAAHISPVHVHPSCHFINLFTGFCLNFCILTSILTVI